MNKAFAILGTFLASFFFLGLLVGLINVLLMAVDGTVVTTATSEREMADLISMRLVPGMQLLLLSGFAYIASVIILLTTSYRTKWYFWCMVIFSFPYLLWFPIWTCLTILVYVYLIKKRHTFLANVD